jgi:hypothetical protein
MSEYRGIDLIQEYDRKSWNRRTGWVIGRPFTGSQIQIERAMELALLAGDTFEMNPGRDGAPWEIVIYYGADETQAPDQPLSDTWELVVNGLEKELWQLPFVRDGFTAIYDGVIASGLPEVTAIDCVNWVRKNIEVYLSGNTDKIKDLGGTEFDLTFQNLVDHISTTGVDKNAVAVWITRIVRLYARGVKAFPLSQFVLKRTRVVANNFAKSNLDAIYNDIFKRRTTDSLKAAEAIPDAVRFELPAGEWVKNVITIKIMTANKWEISEEWWHADIWEKEIYGDPI